MSRQLTRLHQSPRPRYKKRRSRRSMERCAIIVLSLLAWSWIMGTVGMLFYHGYYNRKSKTTTTQGSNNNNNNNNNMPFVPQQQQKDAEMTTDNKVVSTSSYLQPKQSPLLIFTANRDNYLKQTLDDILNYIPHDCSIGCPIVISQDGNRQEVAQVIQDYTAKFAEIQIPVIHLQHKSALRGGQNAYNALAIHYGWALGQVFDDSNDNHQRVVILEEDLHVSSDFFGYMKAMAPLLDQDATLLAVSAFNDNGYKDMVQDATRVVRSDFFPGLGWMMTRKLWDNELRMKWPNGYWDDWLREPSQRQGRQILRPEICRTFHFGFKGGASDNQFGNKHSRILLNQEKVDWEQQDLSILQQDRFDREYWRLLQSARRVESINEGLERSKDETIRIEYTSLPQFQKMARQMNLMDDEKAGIPRTAYKGVVETRPHGNYFLFLTPPIKTLQKDFADAIR